MQYETSRQISYRLNLQTSADLKLRASKGQQESESRNLRLRARDKGMEEAVFVFLYTDVTHL